MESIKNLINPFQLNIKEQISFVIFFVASNETALPKKYLPTNLRRIKK